MTKEEFEAEYKRIFDRAVAMSEITRREGLLALGDRIDEEKLYQRDVMEVGLRLTYDGTDAGITENILTNIINQETDNEKKLLKTVQKTAVLAIHQGYSAGILALTLNSNVEICFENAMKIYLDLNDYKKLFSKDEDNSINGDNDFSEDLINIGDDIFGLAIKYLKGDGVPQDYEKADELFRNSLEIKIENHGKYHLFTALANNLTADQYREHEDYKTAISYYEDALSVYKRIYEQNDQDITNAFCYIAICYESLQCYEKAVEYYEYAVASDEEINGEDNENLAVFFNQISLCYEKSENYFNALKYSMEALAIRKKYSGLEHSSTAYVYYKIGGIYYLMEDYENSLTYYDKAYKAYFKNGGEEDISAVSSLFNAADCYYLVKNYEKALEYDLEVLKIRKKICEINAPELSLSYNNTGTDYRVLGKYEEALNHHLKSLELRKEHCEIKDYIAFSYSNVGKDYEAMGDKKNALNYFKEALWIYETLEGFNNDVEDMMQSIKRCE